LEEADDSWLPPYLVKNSPEERAYLLGKIRSLDKDVHASAEARKRDRKKSTESREKELKAARDQYEAKLAEVPNLNVLKTELVAAQKGLTRLSEENKALAKELKEAKSGFTPPPSPFDIVQGLTREELAEVVYICKEGITLLKWFIAAHERDNLSDEQFELAINIAIKRANLLFTRFDKRTVFNPKQVKESL